MPKLEYPTAITLSWIENLQRDFYNGEISLEDYKKSFDYMVEKKPEIISLLSVKTKDELLKMVGSMAGYRLKSEKKERVVQGVYDEFLGMFQLGGLSYSPFTEKYSDALKNHVHSKTEQNLLDYYAEVKKSREEHAARKAKMLEAINNPQTLEDFKIFLKYKKKDEMTQEQRKLYDSLVSENVLETREKEFKAKAEIKKVEGVTGEMNIIETTHTRDKYPLWVVKLSDRVEKEVYNELNQKAKQLGGWYSSFRGGGAIAGFQFKSLEAAEKFVSIKEGDVSNLEHKESIQKEKSENRASSLREKATKMINDANEELNKERQTNTYRRANMANAADERAYKQKRIANIMLNLANAIDSGEAKYLTHINSKVQVEQLDLYVRAAKREELSKLYKTYSEQLQHEGDEATEETVEYSKATFFPKIYAESIRNTAQKAESRSGGKLVAARWLKRISGLKQDDYYQVRDNDQMEEIKKMLSSLLPNDRKYNRLEEYVEQYSRLKSMKIENDSMLREVLREYVKYRSGTSSGEINKISKLERSLAGRKDIGVDYFPTPSSVAEQMVALAEIEDGMTVLEPSAGNGNLADAVKSIGITPDVIELSSTLREILEAKGYPVVAHDFLGYSEKKYDRIIMNPPFSNGMDADHIKHAYNLLKEGGRIIAIAGEGIFFRSDKKSQDFQSFISDINAQVEKLPENTFMDKKLYSTTGANARLIVIDKLPDTQTKNDEEIKIPSDMITETKQENRFIEIQKKVIIPLLMQRGYQSVPLLEGENSDTRIKFEKNTGVEGITETGEINLYENEDFITIEGAIWIKRDTERVSTPIEIYASISHMDDDFDQLKHNLESSFIDAKEILEVVKFEYANDPKKKFVAVKDTDAPELKEGVEVEKEHSETIEKIASGEVKPEDAPAAIAEDHLKESPTYYEDLKKVENKTTGLNNYDQVPVVWRNTETIKKVNIINSPYNKDLIKLLDPIASNDPLRPIMQGIHFDESGIVATNAHILISLPYPNSEYSGTYATLPKRKFTETEVPDKDMFLDGKYPNYQAVIPKPKDALESGEVSMYKILQYTRAALHYTNNVTKKIVFDYGQGVIGFNGEFLEIVAETALKLGHEKMYYFAKTNNRGIVFSTSKDYKIGEDLILLLMPVMVYDEILGARDIDFAKELNAYYDFKSDTIRNSDGSAVEFKMHYGEYNAISPNELKMLNKWTKPNSIIPMLEFVRVKDGKINGSNMISDVLIKNTSLSDGIYMVKDGAIDFDASETLGSFDEYPNFRRIESGAADLSFGIKPEILRYYIDLISEYTGKDELRPHVNGINFQYKDEKLTIAATNMHVLMKYDLTHYIEVVDIDEKITEFSYIVDKDNLLKFLNNIDDEKLIVEFKASDKLFYIEGINYAYSSRLIDGKYPNVNSVIPSFNKKKLTLNIKDLFKCIRGKEATAFIDKYKKEKKNVRIIDQPSGDANEINIDLYAEEDSHNSYKLLEQLNICKVKYKLEEGNFQSPSSILLIMPVMVNNQSNFNFAFDLKYFRQIIDTVSSEEISFYFSEPNRAYLIYGDSIKIENTTSYNKPEPKTASKIEAPKLEEEKTDAESMKEQFQEANDHVEVKEIEVTDDKKEVEEAIEMLSELVSMQKGKAKKETLEAIELLKDLL